MSADVSPPPVRKIIHIDMDAFYASVEQRDNPDYQGKAIVVGGSPSGRGVVAAASYESRKFGVRSAMSSRRALQLCPHLIFVKPRFHVYKEVSGSIREIFHRYTDLIEPLSLDEAYLDVTADKLGIGSAIEIAQQIRQAIWEELHLTASAGISVNKFVAKVASDLNKPNGQAFIGPSSVTAFMEQLPVEKFHGVGAVTADKMKRMGWFTGADLKRLSEDELVRHFGKSGRFYYRIVRGIDERQVQPHREAKSTGAEDTFPKDLVHTADMYVELERIAALVADRMQRHELKGRTVTLKIKYSDFKIITRNKSFPKPVADAVLIAESAKTMLDATDPEGKPVRLLGISVSNFGDIQVKLAAKDVVQLTLF